MADHKCTECGHVDSGTVIEKGPDSGWDPEVKRVRLPRKVIRDKREFDNTYHPGVESAELYHEVHRIRISDRLPYLVASPMEVSKVLRNPKVLCQNCEGYTSRVKVAYIRDNCTFWDLGPNGPWILRDETNNSTNVWKMDYTVQQFIRGKKPSIPLVEMHRFGGPEDKFHFTIMARAKGSTLDALWDTLTREQLSDILHDLKEHIKQWRQITSPQMQRVDNSELRDIYVGNCTGYGCIKTGHNEEEWLENLTPAIRKGLLWPLWKYNKGAAADQATKDSWIKEVDEKIVQLKAKFPRGGPYVLTHGDLHFGNIFVSDDNPEKKFKVSAIIDWETAGFFPWWMESFRAELRVLGYEILGDDTDIHFPGYTFKDYSDIQKAVDDVRKAWYAGGYHTRSMHGLGEANRWFRQPFSACQPYAQEIRDSALGWEQEHVDMFDMDSSDSEDLESEYHHKFRKDDREYLRWFNQIQWPSQTTTVE